MASVQFREPYSQDELKTLYPSPLRLEHVQVVMRHGERTPVSARFQNTGLAAYWPYCNAARRFREVMMSSSDASEWATLEYKRHVETVGAADSPKLARGSNSSVEGICHPGELTDTGRATTMKLGARLRHLYIDQLKFLPDTLKDPASTVILRSTPIVRAQQSVEQAFQGLYPAAKRDPACPPPTVLTRTMQEETLFPNTGSCKRLNELFNQFGDQAAARWNDSEEMANINKRIGRWMPEESKQIKVDGRPRLSGIMDTTNASLAHENLAKTRLPSEFYDKQVRASVDKIVCDEWYTGFKVNREYRMLGMGNTINDMTSRMIWHVEGRDGEGNMQGNARESDARGNPKLWIAGAHDTTLAGILSSLGAFGTNPWPPFTSHVAVELFSQANSASDERPASKGWFHSLFGRPASTMLVPARSLATKATVTYTQPERDLLKRHYVRIRYNDVPAVIPGCAQAGRHLEGDESFCTLEAFKEIVEAFAPNDFRRQCRENLGKPLDKDAHEPAGWARGDQP